VNKAESHEALRQALAASENCYLAELRRQGKDTFWQWYLLERRLKLTFILAVYPFAKAIVGWMVKPRG